MIACMMTVTWVESVGYFWGGWVLLFDLCFGID